MTSFAARHKSLFRSVDRAISASFEIGCFHCLVKIYEEMGFVCKPMNLVENEFRYLTTPNGNPARFSYILATKGRERVEIRQQVRVRSHIDSDIAFTPDFVVIKSRSKVNSIKDKDFAEAKRSFFFVLSKNVISAHECKSMPPFPELFVSFLGMLILGHKWYQGKKKSVTYKGVHLAPTLFVGGPSSNLHLRMVKAIKKRFPANIVCGMHDSTWEVKSKEMNFIKRPEK